MTSSISIFPLYTIQHTNILSLEKCLPYLSVISARVSPPDWSQGIHICIRSIDHNSLTSSADQLPLLLPLGPNLGLCHALHVPTGRDRRSRPDHPSIPRRSNDLSIAVLEPGVLDRRWRRTPLIHLRQPRKHPCRKSDIGRWRGLVTSVGVVVAVVVSYGAKQ